LRLVQIQQEIDGSAWSQTTSDEAYYPWIPWADPFDGERDSHPGMQKKQINGYGLQKTEFSARTGSVDVKEQLPKSVESPFPSSCHK
jgi:hypothetical protein